jgi:integrase
MASMRKKGKGGHYYARFYDSSRSPKRKEVPLDTTRKKVARRRLVELEEQFEAGEFDPWTDPADRERLTVQEAIGRFLDAKRETVRDSTVDTYEQQLIAWSKTCPPGLTIRTVGPGHLQPFIRTYRADDDEDEPPSNATQRKRYRHLQAFVNWLLDEGIIEQDPMRSVDKPEKQEKQPSFLSPSELEKLIGEIEEHAETVTNIHGEPSDVQWLKDIIQFAVCTGLRRGELVSLQWRDINLEEQFVTVRNRDDFTTKSGDERRVPLRSDALEVARRRDEEHDGDSGDPVFADRSGRPIKADRITKRFKTFVRKAGLDEQEDLHFHSLRHTCGAWLASSGVPLRVIQAILGHSSIDVTEIYSHLQPDVMGEAMEEAFG